MSSVIETYRASSSRASTPLKLSATITESCITSNSESDEESPADAPGWKYKPTTVSFDPEKHLSIEEPAWRKTLEDFGYDRADGISEIGATAAFQLFTEEAIELMRQDLLSDYVQNNHVYSSPRSLYQVRGYCPTKGRPSPARFAYDAWNCPQVLEAVSRAAGIDLVPLMDYEIAIANIQLGAKGPAGVRDICKTPTPPLPLSERPPSSIYDSRPVDDWHFDGVPFVAVLMLSNTTGMQGGETAVQAKDGTVSVVPGPGMGKVVVMQGSCLRHAALRAQNCAERIALVTSLRPKDPNVRDMSHLHNVWMSSDQKELGYQWLAYRMKVLEDRLRLRRENLTRDWNLKELRSFQHDLEDYLQMTMDELDQD